MKILERVNSFFTKIEEGIMVITGFLLLLITLIAVFNRYFLSISMSWYEEIAVIIYMVLVYWGSSNVAKDNGHIGVTFLQNKIKGKVGIYLNLFIELSCLIVSIMGIYFATKMSLTSSMKTVALSIPNSLILFISLVMGFIGLTLRYLYKVILSVNKLNIDHGEGGDLKNV